MSTALLAPHPFGDLITEASLTEKFSHFYQWEDRYRQLIQLSRQLPALPEDLKSAEIELTGCENRVWLSSQLQSNGTLHFYGDSEGRIVRGLLAVLLTAVEGKTPAALLQQDPLALFDTLGLRAQLSASRSSGLQALADAVQRAARQHI
ncbi:cysteine desulfurase sulfur acceptor subunit CsdE [Pantoea phytobeneficialis]|uniref:Cysteine desulfurase sulfur acceptor subunit CsdE n=1 Tax=Pantoea phytobeneficialis TaxID=2052056 RepID=A0AAP9H5T0_9GAMM|nr:cysteine desulfurase sulfur acceptor subunit CsdE [Pantoea phytobeneficialis]MDO6407608.1 cysteine desulfurase sulfur acceptor subunit CsdE [Pantoea phytobeneficialis]QGR07265.1 cysteine desulfurase sulfur acceptor subunit CsdE [Pantoea phytobeneficialis]